MGSIRYKSASVWRVIPTTSFLQQSDIQPPKSPTQIRDAVARTLGVLPEGETGELYAKLPQTLSVQLDANVGRNWFLSGTWWKPSTTVPGAQHRSELITLGGRYETAKLEYSAMLNYWQDLGKVSIGTHVRYGYVTLGSDNLFGFFSYNNLATHLFAGVSIPFGGKSTKTVAAKRQKNLDSDGDGINDQLDLCPDVAGIQAFQGCPDADKDGIQDIEDNCPQQAGLVANKGCPDADGDGIPDKDDACPRDAGPADMKGCPDSDGDGIANNLDECPTVAGRKDLNGCPDSDGDGLRDSKDNCPNEFGLKEFGGCALADIAPTDTVGLFVSEKFLLNQLRTSWIHGPKYTISSLNVLQSYLAANPKRIITMVVSGSSQAQVTSILALFKEELSANSISLERFKFTDNVAVNYKTGLKLGIINAP
ncbi:thrombospondin type 3 repeat-containing protein [Spirosoma sp. BT702]|uniref:Thrombospondin type 3 repeat-containing protein n=2 Tax=Spirosoma profusum TaxID=2771354 RepID=A0A926XU82_9BACT|nr:thrombospondin type 3 repeat-containing protein [Spirosoma profusum]